MLLDRAGDQREWRPGLAPAAGNRVGAQLDRRVVELEALKGRDRLGGYEVVSLLKY